MIQSPLIQKTLDFLRQGYDRFLEAQQFRLSNSIDGILLLSFLGLICGLLAAAIIILFRLAIGYATTELISGGNHEAFELISGSNLLLLCTGGGLIVGLLMQLLKAEARNTGVVHVIERMEYHQGYLPARNAIVQFIAGGISLISGQSVGREGPSIHLGASAGSALGRSLRVPNNGVRILVACGVAAGIAAAFNTPLAGVIFAMEVVLMEYSVIGFAPIIVASVSATGLSHLVFGDHAAFSVPPIEFNVLEQMPIVITMGLMIGAIATFFTRSTLLFDRLFAKQAIWLRITLAGLITGLIAMLVPEVMGTGYDTINHLLLAQVGLAGAMILLVAKLITTSAAIGLGVPAGLIGPTLFIGAAAGGSFAMIAHAFDYGIATASFYAMLGMAAMMAATLQAPLAALICLLELTSNQAIIAPGMAVVISACLVARGLFGQASIYQHVMSARGLDYRNTEMAKSLRRIGVASVMERNLFKHNRLITQQDAQQLLAKDPRWLLIIDDTPGWLLPASDLARHLAELEQTASVEPTKLIDLRAIPAKRLDAYPIPVVASLQEALQAMQQYETRALYVTGAHGATKQRIYGVISREHIDRSYQN